MWITLCLPSIFFSCLCFRDSTASSCSSSCSVACYASESVCRRQSIETSSSCIFLSPSGISHCKRQSRMAGGGQDNEGKGNQSQGTETTNLVLPEEICKERESRLSFSLSLLLNKARAKYGNRESTKVETTRLFRREKWCKTSSFLGLWHVSFFREK